MSDPRIGPGFGSMGPGFASTAPGFIPGASDPRTVNNEALNPLLSKDPRYANVLSPNNTTFVQVTPQGISWPGMGFNSFGLPPNLQGGIPQGQPASANPFLEKRTSGPLPVIENELLPFAFDSIKNSVGGHGPVNSLSNIPLFSSKGFSGRRIEEPSNGKETAVPAMTSSSIQESKSESPTVEQFGINPTGLTVSKINKDGSKTFGFGLGGFNYGKENKEGGYAIGVNPLTRSFRAGVQNPNWGASIQMGLGPTESPNPFGFLQGNIQFGNNPNSTDTPLLNKSLSELAGAVTNPNQGLPSEAQRYAVEELGLPVNPSSSQPESEAQKYLRSFLDSRRTNQQIYW